MKECIAIGWSTLKNAKGLDVGDLSSFDTDELRKMKEGEKQLPRVDAEQIYDFTHNVKIGHKVMASTSG